MGEHQLRHGARWIYLARSRFLQRQAQRGQQGRKSRWERQQQYFLATLLLSQGVPMLLAGDEFGRSQGGNNNAYCQDSEISWIDWQGMDDVGKRLLEFTRSLIQLRREHLVFHRSRFFYGKTIPGTEVKDVMWLRRDGAEMADEDWRNTPGKVFAVRISGEAGLTHLTARGEEEPDDTFMILMNASHEDVVFHIPSESRGARWEVLVDSSDEADKRVGRSYDPGTDIPTQARSLLLLVYQQGARSRPQTRT
jgi:glycogen operon protein